MSLSKNVIIYGAVNAIKSFIPFIMLPILTSYLSPKEYGILSLIEVTILMLLPFVLLNIHGAVKVEYFKLSRTDLSEYISTALILSFLSFSSLTILVMVFQLELSMLLGIPVNVLVWLPVLVGSRVVATLILTVFQVLDKATLFFLFTIIQAAVDFTLSIVLITQFYLGYIGRLEGIYLSFIMASVVGIYLLKRMRLLGKININKYMSQIFHFGVPLIPHALGAVFINMSDRYFISYFIDEIQVGIYTVAYQVAAVMLLVGMSVNQAWSPFMFKLLSTKDNKVYERIISYLGYLVLFFVVSLIAIYIFSDLIFLVFVDEQYLSAKKYFPYLLLGFFFQSLYFICVNFLFYEKKTYLVAKFTVFSALVNVVLNYIFIQEYGVMGVAYSTLITWVVYFLLVIFYVVRLWYPRLYSTTISERI